MNENIIKQILVQFQEKRDRAQRGKESRIRELYTRVPEIKMLDDEIRQTGILLSKAIIQDPEHAEEKLCEIKSTMKELRQQRAILLTDNNIPKDYTDPHFECSKCKDTGFSANGEKCSCLKQAIISHAYEMSNIAYQLKSENFSTFNVNLFPNEPFKEETLTPRQNMMQIMTLVEDFIQNFDKKNGDNLLFYGDTGLGKTFMCNCIAKDLMDKGHVVLYQTSFKMLEVLKEYKFSDYRSRSASLALQYKLIFESDLLIIDDLGTEMPNSFTVAELFNIINSRMISGKKVLISTNLSPSGLSKTYTSRIFSRILKNFKKLNFYGEDLRKNK